MPSVLTNVNGTVYFTANDGVHGRELWKSDGTAAGTVLVKDIHFGSVDPGAFNLTNVNGTLFFAGSNDVNGTELRKSDGTAAGTVLVKDIWAGSRGSLPFCETNVNGTLYFTAADGVNGYELWKSNGTEGGTTLVADIWPGNRGSTPSDLVNVMNTLYFAANDGVSGMELWKGPQLAYIVQAANNAQAQAALAAVNALPAQETALNVELNLAAGVYTDIVAKPPQGVTLIIKGAGKDTVIVGHSPALLVESGKVIVEDVTLTTDTDSPTIEVVGGDLVLRNTSVEETAGGDQAAIAVAGGTVNLGTADDPGGNTLSTDGSGSFVANTSGAAVTAVGNEFESDGDPLSADYRIEDRMLDSLKSGGNGLVVFVPGTIVVTSQNADIQAAIDAASPGFTVQVEAGTYSGLSVDKPLTIAFEDGPVL